MRAHTTNQNRYNTAPQNPPGNPVTEDINHQEPNDSTIKVDVATRYLEQDSDPEGEKFVFAYTITITNMGDMAAKLLTRHWIITHGNGKMQEVKGEGVVGEQPLIKPGQGYQYTSGTILETPVGTMGGSYQMIDEDGHQFNAAIPDFVLSSPHTLH